jgi:O-antigen/teichoic acid export membrane protein
LIKGLSWLILLNFLVKPIWILLIDREVQNQLGHEVYGKYFSLFSLSIMLLFIADAGLSNLLNRQLASQGNLDVMPFIRLKLLFTLFYILMILLVSFLSGIDTWEMLFYIMGIHLLTSYFIFIRSIITAQQLFTADAWFSVIDKILLIILAGSFIYWPGIFGSISIEKFLLAQLLSTFIAVLIAAGFLYSKSTMGAKASLNTIALIRSILPFAMIILLMGIHSRADAFILERIHVQGAYQAGVYALGFRLLDAANMVGYLAASFLVPFIARNRDDQALIEKTVISTRHVLVLMAMIIASFGLIFSSWIQQQLYHSDFSFHSDVIRYCLATLPAYFLIHIYGSLLTATARFRPFIIIMVFAVILNLVLNFILIPSYGALGSCISALVTQYCAGLSCFFVASGKLKIPFYKRSLTLYLLVFLVFTGLFYISRVAIINVWLILAFTVLFTLVFLLTQVKYFKQQFVSR